MKQARGYYTSKGGGKGGGKGKKSKPGQEDRIKLLKERTHFSACGVKGDWAGDDVCPDKDKPRPPRKEKDHEAHMVCNEANNVSMVSAGTGSVNASAFYIDKPARQ
eukprot:8265334-Heterocapsa_arctica.AAC.1